MAQYGNPYGGSGQQEYGGYGAQNQQTSPYGGSGYADPGTDMEMNPMGGASGSPLLDECRAIDLEIDAIDRNLAQLEHLHASTLGDASGSGPASRQVDDLSAQTMSLYRGLTPRVRALKSDPASQQPRNAGQVARVDRRLKDAIHTYQSVEASFQRGIQDQLARQYRIVRPDADDAEVRGAVEDTRGEVFRRALLQSGKQGQANAALGAVQDRHGEIRRIERQMAELAQLFEDVNAAVVMQEADVQRIEDQGEQAVTNLEHGQKHVEEAVKKGWAAKKKKWICLGICVAIVIIVVIIVLAVLGAGGQLGNKNGGGK